MKYGIEHMNKKRMIIPGECASVKTCLQYAAISVLLLAVSMVAWISALGGVWINEVR